VKWIGADGLLCRIPVSTVSALILGPGTNRDARGHESLRRAQRPGVLDRRGFAALLRLRPHAQSYQRKLRLHAEAWADKRRSTQIPRVMFRMRFQDVDVEGKSVKFSHPRGVVRPINRPAPRH